MPETKKQKDGGGNSLDGLVGQEKQKPYPAYCYGRWCDKRDRCFNFTRRFMPYDGSKSVETLKNPTTGECMFFMPNKRICN